MIYDLSSNIDSQRAETYFNSLKEKGNRIELKVKHPRRSISQNSYLHLILSAFGVNFGYTLQEVKQYIFKITVNPTIFYEGEVGEIVKVQRLRSSADLDTSEMTIAIDNFLSYSAKNGYQLPRPEDLVWLDELEKEVSAAEYYLKQENR